MTIIETPRAPWALLLVLGTACATSAPAPASRPGAEAREERSPTGAAARARDEGKGSDRPAGKVVAAPAPDALPARAQRLFSEALKTLEDQRDSKVPVDWALMERKWRAVLDAAEVAEARFNLGVALDNQGNASGAKAEYEAALLAKPGLRQARVNLGVLVERQGDVRAASAIYAAVLRDSPEDAMARERLAALYRASGQLDDAWRLAREALLRDPRATGAYKTMIRIALHRKDLDLAKLIALRAQKLDEADADVAFLLGEVLERQGEEAAATAQWNKTLALAPGHLPARYALLDQAVRKEAWPRVAEQAGAILAAEPKNAAVVLLRGIALRHAEKADEALEAYEKAEKLSRGALAEVYLARGVLLMRDRSECEPARAEFDRYVKAVGPILPKGSPVPGLQRECDEQLAANKAAAEAARQMQLDAEKNAAKKSAEGGEAASSAGAGRALKAGPHASGGSDGVVDFQLVQ